MYHNHKNNIQKHLFFPKCNQTRKEGDEKSDLSYSYRYSKFFKKDYEDAYQNLALFNELTTVKHRGKVK
jgi:hypothetical protein